MGMNTLGTSGSLSRVLPGLGAIRGVCICAVLNSICSFGATAQSNAVFPLKISQTGRYLVDQENKPFLVVGDTPWSLIAQLDESSIDRYLTDRRSRGFNSIIVNLIEHKFSSAPPKTRAGLAPFDKAGDFSTPNKDYFEFAHRIVQKANNQRIVVWLAPAYLGFGGGPEGFFKEMKASGKQELHSYGNFVGDHFKDLPNIVWLLGGDFTPPPADRWTVTELATAIRETDTNHLMTVHDAPENSASSVFGGESWLTLNTVYSYEPTLFRRCLAEFAREPARPFVLIESTYEGEHDSKPDQIRRQAYWAMLGGCCGQFFGNNPIWHFDGPGLFPIKSGWLESLDSQGSHDMSCLGKLFRSLPWQELRPEKNHSLVTDGYGEELGRVLTAQSSDRKLAVTYVPSVAGERELTIDQSQFAGSVSARWFNPVSGTSSDAKIDTSGTNGRLRLRVPGDNGAKANDWVLILESR